MQTKTKRATRSRSSTNLRVGDKVSLAEIEREHIARVIARSPTLEEAAKLLGIDITTLYRKRQRYRLG